MDIAVITEKACLPVFDATSSPVFPAFVDPLDPDVAEDLPVVTTARGLVRLALVASETGARFALSGLARDPMAWLLAPRDAFQGRAAVEACMELRDCRRAVVLHAAGLLDCDPEILDRLDGDEDWDPAEAERSLAAHASRAPELYTATVHRVDGLGLVQAFAARVTNRRDEFERVLHARYPLADVLDVVAGFDAGLPLVEALVSPTMAAMLSDVAADPCSRLAEGLDVVVEQRFAA